jgi:hypothetical protein
VEALGDRGHRQCSPGSAKSDCRQSADLYTGAKYEVKHEQRRSRNSAGWRPSPSRPDSNRHGWRMGLDRRCSCPHRLGGIVPSLFTTRNQHLQNKDPLNKQVTLSTMAVVSWRREVYQCTVTKSGRSRVRRLTTRSNGAPTAGRQARPAGTVYIFTSPGLAPCRCRPLSSNVRPHKPTFTHRNSSTRISHPT